MAKTDWVVTSLGNFPVAGPREKVYLNRMWALEPEVTVVVPQSAPPQSVPGPPMGEALPQASPKARDPPGPGISDLTELSPAICLLSHGHQSWARGKQRCPDASDRG